MPILSQLLLYNFYGPAPMKFHFPIQSILNPLIVECYNFNLTITFVSWKNLSSCYYENRIFAIFVIIFKYKVNSELLNCENSQNQLWKVLKIHLFFQIKILKTSYFGITELWKLLKKSYHWFSVVWKYSKLNQN